MRRTLPTAVSVLALSVFPTYVLGQTGSLRVTLPSPTAASLGKFGDVPVSLYTGVPDISIPLFTAKGKTIELPITLRYHAGGIKVQELGGWVGIGWTLDAGGVITRTVRGLADEGPGGYYSTGQTWYDNSNWPTPQNSTIDLVTSEQLDGQPDQFFFSFAGRSGQFVMGPDNSNGRIEYRAIPYQDLAIQPAPDFSSWTITAEDGTTYTFAAIETNTDYNTTQPGSEMPVHYGESYISAWYLTKVRSPAGDSIMLTYAPYTARHRLATYIETFNQVVSPPGQPQCVPSYYSVTNEYVVSGQQLASIASAADTITFSTSLRADALNPTNNAQQEPRLDTVTVETPGSTVLRKFRLEYDYSVGGRLTLKNLYEQDPSGTALPPYSFTYSGPSLPSPDSYAVDHWGYYNGRSNTGYVPPAITPSGAMLTGADRTPDSAFTKAGVLTRITYPTGGYNEFVYQTNDYGWIGATDSVLKDFGPPQSASVGSNAAGNGPGPQSATFTVGGTDTIVAYVNVSLNPSDCGNQTGCPNAGITGVGYWQVPGDYQVRLGPGTYTATASDEYITGAYAIITIDWQNLDIVKTKLGGGLRVAEVHTADAMGNVTVRKYSYVKQSDTTRSSGVVSFEPAYAFQYNSSYCTYFSRASMSKMPLGSGAAVGYSEVTVSLGANGEFGTTRHTFRSALDAPDQGANGFPYYTPTSFEWARGQETGSTDYNASGAIQRRSARTYAFRYGEPVTYRAYRGMSLDPFSAGVAGGSIYYYDAYSVISEWAYQDGDTTTIYDENGANPFSTMKSFVYGNPRHIQLTQLTETNSDGTQRITRLKYPGDYDSTGTDPVGLALAAMQGPAHMHSQVIERWVSRVVGGVEHVVQAQLTAFKQYLAGQILPYERFMLNNPGVTP